MSCKEVFTFRLDMGAPISLLSRMVASSPGNGRTPRQAEPPALVNPAGLARRGEHELNGFAFLAPHHG
jgi:hypothetical protein